MAIATPTVNPLDIPSPRPSEILRSWPERNWCKRFVRLVEDGTIRMCAIGVLGEVAGHDWSRGPDGIRDTIHDAYGVARDDLAELSQINDRCGKDAAADFLAARGY